MLMKREVLFEKLLNEMKSKLFIVCLAAMLISGGCAESKPMGESSEAKEPNVILADSQIVESNIVSSNGMIRR